MDSIPWGTNKGSSSQILLLKFDAKTDGQPEHKL